MFNAKVIPYVNTLGALEISATDKMFVGAAAVAATVVEMLEMPSAPVDTPEDYFSKHAGMMVRDQVGNFNEAAPIDTQMAQTLARKFWLFRYNLLYGTRPYVGVDGDFFCGYTQPCLFFSDVEMAALNRNAVAIARLQNQIRVILEVVGRPGSVAMGGDKAVESPITDTVHVGF
jgi:hypothetical protein